MQEYMRLSAWRLAANPRAEYGVKFLKWDYAYNRFLPNPCCPWHGRGGSVAYCIFPSIGKAKG